MKTFINTLSNTYKAVRLLSNPAVSAIIEKELGTKPIQNTPAPRFGKNDAFYHKHYMVQVVN